MTGEQGTFEDVPKDQTDLNQAAPTYTALYLLNLPDPGAVDPQVAFPSEPPDRMGAAAFLGRSVRRGVGDRLNRGPLPGTTCAAQQPDSAVTPQDGRPSMPSITRRPAICRRRTTHFDR